MRGGIWFTETESQRKGRGKVCVRESSRVRQRQAHLLWLSCSLLQELSAACEVGGSAFKPSDYVFSDGLIESSPSQKLLGRDKVAADLAQQGKMMYGRVNGKDSVSRDQRELQQA
jgi:hypothetical protein